MLMPPLGRPRCGDSGVIILRTNANWRDLHTHEIDDVVQLYNMPGVSVLVADSATFPHTCSSLAFVKALTDLFARQACYDRR